MGLDVWLVEVCWIEKLVSVFWWVELDFFSLESNGVSSSEFWVYGYGVTLASLYIDTQGYVPSFLENCVVCLALELIGSWVVVGFSVGMEAFG